MSDTKQPPLEVLQTIAFVQGRQEAYREMEDWLTRQFLNGNGGKVQPNSDPLKFEKANGHVHVPRSRTAKRILYDFLKANGPMAKKDILAKSEMPPGTISSCLNDRNMFQQVERGFWGVVEESKTAK
jgi:hypothetical protein